MAPEPMHQDPLLSELNSDPATKIEAVDAPHKTTPPNPLEIQTPAPLSPVAAANKKHSTAHGGKGYHVTVKGNYRAPEPGSGSGKILKPYEISFTLPTLDCAMSVAKNKMLPVLLPKKYPDYLSLQTHEIVEATPLSPTLPETKNLQFMNRGQLEAHAREYANGVIDPSNYPDIALLREAIIDHHQNPLGFKERQELKLKDIAQDAELAALNPEMADEPVVHLSSVSPVHTPPQPSSVTTATTHTPAGVHTEPESILE